MCKTISNFFSWKAYFLAGAGLSFFFLGEIGMCFIMYHKYFTFFAVFFVYILFVSFIYNIINVTSTKKSKIVITLSVSSYEGFFGRSGFRASDRTLLQNSSIFCDVTSAIMFALPVRLRGIFKKLFKILISKIQID